MSKLQKVLFSFLLGIIVLISGTLIHNLKILDAAFGLSVYVLDLLGIWKPGPGWVTDHRITAGFCFLIFPLIISFLLSTGIVLIFEKLWKHSKQLGLLFFVGIFILIYGLHSSNYNGISYFGYLTSNY